MSNNKDNINHHIILNKGTWWCNVTVRTDSVTSERIRFSLKTKDVDKARTRRDRVFKGIMEHYTIASIKA